MHDAQDNDDCFVVSPIGEIGTPTYKRAKNVLDYIIKPAAKSVGLVAKRADDLSQPGSITTQVIQKLLNAKAVVADLTGLNANVFYELAVRDSFGLPVVLIAEGGTELPFDVIQQRTIFFDSTDLSSAIPARDAIAKALKAALEDPGASSPVKAAVDLDALRSGDPEARQVAGLAAKVEQMARQLAALQPAPATDVANVPRKDLRSWLREKPDADLLQRVKRGEEPGQTRAARLSGQLAREVLAERGYALRGGEVPQE